MSYPANVCFIAPFMRIDCKQYKFLTILNDLKSKVTVLFLCLFAVLLVVSMLCTQLKATTNRFE